MIGIELVEKIVRVAVRRAVAQRRHRIEIADRAARFLGRIHALRLVDDDDGVGGLNELDRPPPRHAVVLAVDDVELLQLVLGHLRQVFVGNILLEGLDVDDHDLNLVAGRELPHLAEPLRVIDEVIERRLVVERLEMLLRHVDALEHAFADGDARHDDDEFPEAVGLVQLEDRAQIDVGLAGAGLHLDGEFAALKRRDLLDVVRFLNRLDILENFVIRQH